MAAGEPEPEPSVTREVASFLAGLGLVILLAGACVSAPLVVTVYDGPWAGVAVAAGSCCVWSWFGPRPMPGFLSGILCLWGYAAILGVLLGCAALAVRSLFV
jgi:hypothetical protein